MSYKSINVSWKVHRRVNSSFELHFKQKYFSELRSSVLCSFLVHLNFILLFFFQKLHIFDSSDIDKFARSDYISFPLTIYFFVLLYLEWKVFNPKSINVFISHS